jgi:hypothetical protein
MLPFGMTIPVTVPQRSEIPEGLTNYPVLYFSLKEMEQRGEEMNLEFHWSRCMTGSFLKE